MSADGGHRIAHSCQPTASPADVRSASCRALRASQKSAHIVTEVLIRPTDSDAISNGQPLVPSCTVSRATQDNRNRHIVMLTSRMS